MALGAGHSVPVEGAAATVGGAVDVINEAAKKLEGLAKTEDFSPLTGIVDEIAGLAGRKFDESEDLKLMVCFSEAVARLHNAVFDREFRRIAYTGTMGWRQKLNRPAHEVAIGIWLAGLT